jgi:S1-C subfamily serine protease
MCATRQVLTIWATVTVLWLCCVCQSLPAFAQGTQRVDKDDASLVVDGVVLQVFTGSDQARSEQLVQIEVRRSDARRAMNARTRIPAPGEVVYVHVTQQSNARLFTRPDGNGAVPAERAQVRAYLVPRDNGVWQGAYPDWFEPISGSVAPASPLGSSAGTAGGPTDRSSVASLGMTYEPHMVKDRLVLRVKSVERGGPAQQAGIEAGDVIIGIKEDPLRSAGQLDELARTGEPISLMVVDVNTSRPANVELRPSQRSDASVGANAQSAPAQRRSLGLTAETIRVGLRTALKVTRVEAGSPAQKAGIEPDDILVAANGVPLTGPDQLGASLRKSGPTLTLTVRDSRTGKDVPVDVMVGGPAIQSSIPADAPAISPATERLGAVTELSFYDVEVALKVTEVEPGSPAARAGLQPGSLIISANGTPVLHPNELNAAVQSSNGTLRLTVVNPRTNAKDTLQVNLSR